MPAYGAINDGEDELLAKKEAILSQDIDIFDESGSQTTQPTYVTNSTFHIALPIPN